MESAPAIAPSFIADSMLGRLARYLRFLGFDAAYERDIAGARLVARAQGEGRILLSRDTGIFEMKVVSGGAVRALLLRSSNTMEQLRQVAREAGIAAFPELPSRCVECNGLLEELAPAEARQLSPPYVRATQVEISYCSCCHHAVWRGSHWDRFAADLRRAALL